MAKTIGVTLSEQVLAGLVVDHKLVGELQRFPANEDDRDALIEMHTDALVQTICEQVTAAATGAKDPVPIRNDGEGVAAGLAASHGKLDHMIRVWTIGVGIGHGRYPFAPGVWGGGHLVGKLRDR